MPKEAEAKERVRTVMRENAVNQFTYHAPVGNQAERYTKVRQACLDAALVMIEESPVCIELTAAIASLREAMMWCNAGIACTTTDGEGDDVHPPAGGRH